MKFFKQYLIITSVFTLFILFFHFDLMTHLGNRMLGDYEDGIKNYYTPMYHVMHDSTFSKFGGMNYPYGEQVVFTDNQPTLSNFLKLIQRAFGVLSFGSILWIMNFMMLFSILAAALFIYDILRQFQGKNSLVSAVFSILLALLSPQIMRMGGHYALAYSFVIPLIWWLLIKFYKQPSTIKSVVMALVIILCAGLHFYYLALGIAFIGLTHFFYLSLYNRSIANKRLIGQILIQIVVPVVVMYLWIYLTQDASMRPKNPYGFLAYRGHWEGVFLPLGKPIGTLINQIIPIRNVPWEGVAYIGLFGSFTFIGVLFYVIPKKIMSKQRLEVASFENNLLFANILAAFVLLLFAFGVPFIFKLQFLVDYLGPLKQFRGIGRFAWIFFYVFNVFAFLIFIKLTPKREWLFVFPIALLTYDSVTHHMQLPYQQNEIPEISVGNSEDAEHWKNIFSTDNFQAILPLPYFHVGSENINMTPKNSSILKESMTASLLLGLPIMAVQMSRTDLVQTFNNIELVLDNLDYPEIVLDLPIEKHLLVIRDKKAALSDYENEIFKKSFLIYENEDIAILDFDIWQFYEWRLEQNKRKNWNKFKSIQDSSKRNYIESDSSLFLFVEHFENKHQIYPTDKLGNSKLLALQNWTNITSFSYHEKDSVNVRVSFWAYLLEDGAANTTLVVSGTDSNNENQHWEAHGLKDLIEVVYGGFALLEFNVCLKSGLDYDIALKNEGYKKDFQIHRLMIIENGLSVFEKNKDYLWHNNRFYTKPTEEGFYYQTKDQIPSREKIF